DTATAAAPLAEPSRTTRGVAGGVPRRATGATTTRLSGRRRPARCADGSAEAEGRSEAATRAAREAAARRHAAAGVEDGNDEAGRGHDHRRATGGIGIAVA